MPELISLYEAHADHRDRFEIISIHDNSVQTFAELDKKLPKLKEQFWQGKDLPFPVLLDAAGKTVELYGIHAFPTTLLIDPEGKLIGEASPAELEAKLPPLPVAKQWARHRDLHANSHWNLEPSKDTLAKFADTFKQLTGREVELDLDAVKASGLTPDGPLPGVLIGVNVTLRSVDELFLAPHGLGVAPSADGKKLLITKRPTTTESESYLQKLHARELNDRLDHGSAEPSDPFPAKPLRIKDETLLDAIKQINREFDLQPIALDAKAMQAKMLDPAAKVSGIIDPNGLRKSLT